MESTPDRVVQRALARVVASGSCWLSTYSVGSHGYPQIGWTSAGKTTMRLVHRVTWESAHGPIPDGQTVDHVRPTCPGPPCVNPAHMRLLDNFENARRTRGRNWPVGECARGHSNAHIVAVGKAKRRRCRVCVREDQIAYRARKQSAR